MKHRPDRAKQRAWEEHARSQMRYFLSLRLRERMQAVEDMAEVVRRFEAIREAGGFRSPSDSGDEP